MPKTLTKAQRDRLHDLQMLVFATRDMVYRAAPRDDVPLSECRKLAPKGHVEMLDHANRQLDEFERAMLAAGRGYRDSLGSFRAY